MSDTVFIYITAADQEGAKAIAQALLEKRLIACANIFPAHEAMYHWEGKVESSQEVAMIAKSQATLFEDIKAAVIDIHPYDNPCVIALPIQDGAEEFLAWIEQETS